MFKKEFEDVFRTLALEGYAILFISHDKTKTITKSSGIEYTKIVPTVSDSINNIVMNMSDIIGYAYLDDNGERFLILRGGNDVTAGTRFPYMTSKIVFSYKDLVKALNDAIDEEEKRNGSSAIGERKVINLGEDVYNFEDLKSEFNDIVGQLLQKDQAYYPPRITQVTDKYLGKGKKVVETTIDQAESIYYINKELREEYLNKK